MSGWSVDLNCWWFSRWQFLSESTPQQDFREKRLLSVRYKRRSGNFPNTSLFFSKMFHFLILKQLCLKSKLCFQGEEKKKGGWVGLWSSKIFQVYLKRYSWKNFGKNCFLALENQFLLPDLMCEGKVLILEFLAQVQHRKLKFIFPNPFCNSVWIKSSSTPRTNCFAAILIASELCHWHPS